MRKAIKIVNMGLLMLLSHSVVAQRIAMIDIIGTADSVIPAFKKHGLTEKSSNANSHTLVGKLAGENATMVFYHTPLTQHIYLVTVTYNQTYSKEMLFNAFEERVKKIISRYALPNSINLNDGKTQMKLDQSNKDSVMLGKNQSSSQAAEVFKLPANAMRVIWNNMQYFTNSIIECYPNSSNQIVVEYWVKDNMRKLDAENAMKPKNALEF